VGQVETIVCSSDIFSGDASFASRILTRTASSDSFDTCNDSPPSIQTLVAASCQISLSHFVFGAMQYSIFKLYADSR
jgi:hypothetical protein